MSQLIFDEEAARRIEAIYLIRDAVRRRAIVREALGAASGERILDVGCGPGYYCAELLDQVGPAGSVVGIDGSAAMLALAERRCAGHANVAFHEADATALPVADGDFDAAISVQVQEYVPDVEVGLAELHRALRPGGRVLVFDIDWATLSVNADDPARSARVLRAWDDHLAHASLPRTLAARLRDAGFEDVRWQAHPFVALDFDEGTYYGAALVPFIAAFVPGHGDVGAEDAEAWLREQRALGERGEFYFAVTQFCFTARRKS